MVAQINWRVLPEKNLSFNWSYTTKSDVTYRLLKITHAFRRSVLKVVLFTYSCYGDEKIKLYLISWSVTTSAPLWNKQIIPNKCLAKNKRIKSEHVSVRKNVVLYILHTFCYIWQIKKTDLFEKDSPIF